MCVHTGVMDCEEGTVEDSRTALGRQTAGGESPVCEIRDRSGSIRSTVRHVEPCGKSGGPPPKAKYYSVTDSAKYCEGTVKSTPGGE